MDLSELDAKKLTTVVSVTRRFKLRNGNHEPGRKPVLNDSELLCLLMAQHLLRSRRTGNGSAMRAPDGMPIIWGVANPKIGEREVTEAPPA